MQRPTSGVAYAGRDSAPSGPIRIGFGCFWTDALVFYIECRGLPANTLIGLFLDYWMSMIYVVIFSVYIWPIPIALLMWSPVIFLLWRFFRSTYNLARARSEELKRDQDTWDP